MQIEVNIDDHLKKCRGQKMSGSSLTFDRKENGGSQIQEPVVCLLQYPLFFKIILHCFQVELSAHKAFPVQCQFLQAKQQYHIQPEPKKKETIFSNRRKKKPGLTFDRKKIEECQT